VARKSRKFITRITSRRVRTNARYPADHGRRVDFDGIGRIFFFFYPTGRRGQVGESLESSKRIRPRAIISFNRIQKDRARVSTFLNPCADYYVMSTFILRNGLIER